MAMIRWCAIGVGWFLATGQAWAGEPVALREVARPGDSTRVVIEMKAEGSYLPGGPAAGAAGAEPKAYALKAETRFAFDERVLSAGPDGSTRRAVRRVIQAASAVGGDLRPFVTTLRPEVARLLVEIRQGEPVAFSPDGPLTRPELEVVQAPGDPLVLAALLPERPVEVGARWKVGDLAARGLSGYDALASHALEASLEAIDADSARFRLLGSVRGAVLGGEGSMAFDGTFRLDRKAGRIDALSLSRAEVRKPGPVEEGLDVKSTLTLARVGVETPEALNDAALADLPSTPDPARELVLFDAPGGRYVLRHDRDWHLHSDNERQTVFKRLDRGELVAQCNIAAGPNAGRGRHQDPAQFREDIRKAIGARFVQVIGEGEVQGAPAGNFRYKVAVQGRDADISILWYYYLVASPEGEQLLVTFTLGAAQEKAFADQDAKLVGSLEWGDRPGSGTGVGARP